MANERVRESFQGLLLRYRGRTGLTQRQLAERVGVNMRSVQGWEGGVSYPTAEPLERLILVYLEAGVLAAGHEAAEAEALWSQAQEESPRQRPPFDRARFAELLARRERGPTEPATAPALPSVARPGLARLQDWGDAPDTLGFVGRGDELATLAACLGQNTCRLVALLGIGGVGKTTLASRLARDLAPSFERVFWRSVRNTPPLNEWLAAAIGFLSGQELVPPEGDEARLLALLQLLRAGRCLLILDNFESLLEPGSAEVTYREGSGDYGGLLRLVAETAHQSCLIVTSREAPPELAQIGASHGRAEVLEVHGLGVDESRALLSDKQLSGADAAWADLVGRLAQKLGNEPRGGQAFPAQQAAVTHTLQHRLAYGIGLARVCQDVEHEARNPRVVEPAQIEQRVQFPGDVRGGRSQDLREPFEIVHLQTRVWAARADVGPG